MRAYIFNDKSREKMRQWENRSDQWGKLYDASDFERYAKHDVFSCTPSKEGNGEKIILCHKTKEINLENSDLYPSIMCTLKSVKSD